MIESYHECFSVKHIFLIRCLFLVFANGPLAPKAPEGSLKLVDPALLNRKK